MRSDGLESKAYSTHNHLMFISQERGVQDMYEPEPEVDMTSVLSSNCKSSIVVQPPLAQCGGDRRSTSKFPLSSLRLEPNRRQPDADALPQITRGIPSTSTDCLSTHNSSHHRLSRLSRFFDTFKSPIGINSVIADFTHRVANSCLLWFSRCSGPSYWQTFAKITGFLVGVYALIHVPFDLPDVIGLRVILSASNVW